MMKIIMMKSRSKLLAIFLVLSLIVSMVSMFAYAENINDDPFIVVSMGDSYSSGEGIEKFYGQDLHVESKVENYDWLAHRSTKSWPGLLVVPDITENGKTMSNYKKDDIIVVCLSGRGDKDMEQILSM